MSWDAVVVGSGFGGALAAHSLVEAGARVLMLERGGWVARGPENWGRRGAGLVTSAYSTETPYRLVGGGVARRIGGWHCVGGQSVFYGGASFRFRASDFLPDPHLVADSGAAWPFGYEELEPWYSRAEQLLGVAGEAGADPTEPPRSAPYPEAPAPLSSHSSRIADAARRLGLHPSRIPLAISYRASDARRGCIGCGQCDGYACAAEAKNDLATGLIPDLLRRGMTLRPNTVCTRLLREGSRVAGVEYVDRVTGAHGRITARQVVLAAGALATPHLLLASDLARASPAPAAVGRFLTRHRNVVVFGLWPRRPNPARAFDKQLAIHDFYLGAPDPDAPPGPLGGIQQLTPPRGLVRAHVGPLLRDAASLVLAHSAGLLVIAEDQPRHANGVVLDRSRRDAFGMPGLDVRHGYTARDEASARVLVRHARRVLREAGALLSWTYAIDTFTHAAGTVRMGPDPRTAPLDGDGRYRGVDALWVSDASALPRSAGVNPSLTIAANALRVGARAAEALGAAAPAVAGTRHAPHRSRLPLLDLAP